MVMAYTLFGEHHIRNVGGSRVQIPSSLSQKRKSLCFRGGSFVGGVRKLLGVVFVGGAEFGFVFFVGDVDEDIAWLAFKYLA